MTLDPAIAPLPDWLAALMRQAEGPARKKRDTQPATDLDTPDAIARATSWLENDAPISQEGAGGDDTAYRAAARIKDFGISEPQAYELMSDHWNERCEPPWSPEELTRKIANAYQYGENAPGSASPAAEFEAVTIDENINPFDTEPKRKRPPLYFILPHEIEIDLNHVALIEDVFDQGAMAVIYGDSHVGKSYVVLDLAYHVAAGKPWREKRVEQGAVVYVAAEGAGSMQKRIQALKLRHQHDDFPVALVPCPVDLLHKGADTAPLIEVIRAAGEKTGLPVRMVVIDTLARAMAGGNENASEDMGAFVTNVDRVRTSVGALVCVVHHTGKDKAKGARGHSSLRAATDTEMEVERGVFRITKQRDMEAASPFGFRLVTVTLGENAYGKPITACVVEQDSVSAVRDFAEVGLTKQQRGALDCLRELIAEEGIEPENIDDENVWGRCVLVGTWRDCVRDKMGLSRSATRQAFKRVRDKIEEAGFVEISGDYIWLREA